MILVDLMKSTVTSFGFKLVVAAAIFYLLIHFNRFDYSAIFQLAASWPWLVVAVICMLPSYPVVSLRTQLILKSLDITVHFADIFRWTMIGSFFDLAMPSSNGGDVIKAGYVVKSAGEGQRTRAVMAIAFDRILGLLGLFLLAFLAGCFGWQLLGDMPARGLVVMLSLTASIGTLFCFRILGARRLYRNGTLNNFLIQFRWGVRLQQLLASFNLLRERPKYLWGALGLSLLNHVLWCASLFCVAHAVGNSIDLIKGLVVFPLAIFSNIFGVAGGFGGGTVGFDLLLSRLLAISNGALIGLAFQILSSLTRLCGLPFYLLSGKRS